MANPYRNTGKAGTGSPVHLNIGGALAKAGKALLKRFTKSKPKPPNTFKQFHRDGKVYDTKSINEAFEQRFGKPKPNIADDGWQTDLNRPLSTNRHWLGDADPMWTGARARHDAAKAIRDTRNVQGPVTEMTGRRSTFDYVLPPVAGGTGYAIAKNEEEVKRNKAKQKSKAARQGR